MREFDLFEDVSAFSVDFEKAVHNAASRVFPGVTIECCYFHFSQANWRKIVDLGLRSKYVHDIEFGMKARMFTALAFPPSEHVRNAFAQLQSIQCSDEGLQNYMEYFERNFIGRYKSSIKNGKLSLKWKEPRYSIECWSIYERVLSHDPRTTNFLEGWHRRFSCVVGVSHPDIYKFIASLKGEQARTEMIIGALVRGEEPDGPRKKEITKNKIIYSIVSTFKIE